MSNVQTKFVTDFLARYSVLQSALKEPQDVLDRVYMEILTAGYTINDNYTATPAELAHISLIIFNDIKKKHKTMPITPSTVEAKIRSFLNQTKDWIGRKYIGEENRQMYVLDKKGEKTYVSNFVLVPDHTVVVPHGYKYAVYQVLIHGSDKTYTVRLSQKDFSSISEFRNRLSEQITDELINIDDCPVSSLFHKYVTLANFNQEKLGTSIIGLERFENDGPKYFCTPDGIYDLKGNISNDITYIMNEYTDTTELSKLVNLEYDANKWPDIAREFLRNVLHIHDREAMLAILGWIGAIPHDYVIRKECGTGFFPHCHVVGERGSGKTTVLTLLKQFLGYNESAPVAMTSKNALETSLNFSYTIPAVLDEYDKNWTEFQRDSINNALVAAYTKSPFKKGTASSKTIYFKYKNPLLMAGEKPTTDPAVATRVIPAYLYKFFHGTSLGRKAQEHINNLQKMEDKNFWVGYNLWCAKHSNAKVAKLYEHFRAMARKQVSESRVADNYAVVMMGLQCILKLAEELGIVDEIGYTEEDINKMCDYLNKSAEASGTANISKLHEFLHDVASLGIQYGNGPTIGNLFGTGLAVMVYQPVKNDAGKYGLRDNLKDACIYGRRCILIKVKDMINVINRHMNKKYNEGDIMVLIHGEFRNTQANGNRGLVLAPHQYRVNAGMYTAFDAEILTELVPEFEDIKWLPKVIVSEKTKKSHK